MRARSCSARRSCRSASCGRSSALKEVTHEFIDLQYDPAEGSEERHRAHVRAGGEAPCATASSCCCCRIATSCKGKLPGARAARHGRRASPPRAQRACAASATCSSRPARRAIRIISPVCIGYGATAVYPYMAYQVLFEMMRKGRVKLDFATRLELGRSYRAGVRKGLFKIMSKMGISTIASYRSSQLFEIVGLSDEVVNMCFTGTESRIQGADFDDLEVGPEAARRARLESARADGAGRPAQVRARRRVPHVQPRRDRDAAGGGDVRATTSSTSCLRSS